MSKFPQIYGCRHRLIKQAIFYITIATGCIVLWTISVAHHPKSTSVKTSQNKTRKSRNHTWKYSMVTGNNEIAGTDYFKPRKDIINPSTYKRVIQPMRVCADEPFLIILVCSIHSHTNVRDGIRDTWGSVGHGSTWPGSDVRLKVKVIFLFGKVLYPTEDYLLSQESRNYNDILQGSFRDSYENLSNKMLMGLRFVAEECPATQYILKADEDTFTNVQSVYAFLETKVPANSVVGHIYINGYVRRVGKWAMPPTIYPFEIYPYYAAGNTYILSRDLINCIVRASTHFPYVFIEDVFITGILATVCQANLVDLSGFTHWDQITPTPDDFAKGDKLSANKVSPGLAREIWAVLLEDSQPNVA